MRSIARQIVIDIFAKYDIPFSEDEECIDWIVEDLSKLVAPERAYLVEALATMGAALEELGK